MSTGLERNANNTGTSGLSGSETDIDPQTPVLRINQLDALELDSALEQLLWTRFSQCFQNCRPGLLTPAEPELRALLQLLVWRFTLYTNSTTVGQSLLSLRYHNLLSSVACYKPLSCRQKWGLALLSIGARWFQERSHSLLLCLGLSAGGSVSEHDTNLIAKGLRKCFNLVSSIAHIANLINFLVFLKKGRHPLLAERIVGAQAVFSKPNVVRNVTYQYMNRELLWHGFSEFLIFLLPLINMRQLKDIVSSFGEVRLDKQAASEGKGLLKECGLCGKWPTMPHTVGCCHVFCYYCIKSHSIAEPYVTCPKCGVRASQPQPLRIQVEMR